PAPLGETRGRPASHGVRQRSSSAPGQGVWGGAAGSAPEARGSRLSPDDQESGHRRMTAGPTAEAFREDREGPGPRARQQRPLGIPFGCGAELVGKVRLGKVGAEPETPNVDRSGPREPAAESGSAGPAGGERGKAGA